MNFTDLEQVSQKKDNPGGEDKKQIKVNNIAYYNFLVQIDIIP
jgi:hypothetical protein